MISLMVVLLWRSLPTMPWIMVLWAVFSRVSFWAQASSTWILKVYVHSENERNKFIKEKLTSRCFFKMPKSELNRVTIQLGISLK